jgi:hypothetical protein
MKAHMEERTIIEVGTTDAELLKRSLGIPEDDIYIELEPGVNLYWSAENVQVRRGGTDVLPYLVEFIIAVAAPLTTNAITSLVKKIHEGGGHTITIVKRYEIKITVDDQKKVEKIQKLLTEKDDEVE